MANEKIVTKFHTYDLEGLDKELSTIIEESGLESKITKRDDGGITIEILGIKETK